MTGPDGLAAWLCRRDFPPAVVLERLRGAGFESYAVGGCVRDALLGREPQDWDIATAAHPEQVTALFTRTIPTGLKHGTVTVLLDGRTVEVTTFRAEGGYSDGRRPDSVRFGVSAAEDFTRRDFTVNAIGWNPDGLYDPVGGCRDLQRRVLRCVGEPEVRFAEDALRILRAVRFAAQLGFSVEPDTEAAMRDAEPLLAAIAAERVFTELDKLLHAPKPEAALERYAAILRRYISPLRYQGIDGCPIAVRWPYALSEMTPQRAADTLDTLRADKALRERVRGVLRCDKECLDPLPQALRRYGADCVRDRLLLEGRDTSEWDMLTGDPHACYSVKQLAVGGDDLIALGVPPGRELGALLERLLDDVLSGQIKNERDALSSHIRHIFFNKP